MPALQGYLKVHTLLAALLDLQQMEGQRVGSAPGQTFGAAACRRRRRWVSEGSSPHPPVLRVGLDHANDVHAFTGPPAPCSGEHGGGAAAESAPRCRQHRVAPVQRRCCRCGAAPFLRGSSPRCISTHRSLVGHGGDWLLLWLLGRCLGLKRGRGGPAQPTRASQRPRHMLSSSFPARSQPDSASTTDQEAAAIGCKPTDACYQPTSRRPAPPPCIPQLIAEQHTICRGRRSIIAISRRPANPPRYH